MAKDNRDEKEDGKNKNLVMNSDWGFGMSTNMHRPDAQSSPLCVCALHEFGFCGYFDSF